MKPKNIYHLFLKKIENQGSKTSEKKEKFRVIISFEDVSKRESFISKYKKLNILDKFDLIPSLITVLDTKQILKYEKEELIKRIEEDQKLFLSILEVNEILDLNKGKISQIPHTGRNVRIGIVDNGINSNFPSISSVSRFDDKGNEFKKEIGNQITHGTIMASIINPKVMKTNFIAEILFAFFFPNAAVGISICDLDSSLFKRRKSISKSFTDW